MPNNNILTKYNLPTGVCKHTGFLLRGNICPRDINL